MAQNKHPELLTLHVWDWHSNPAGVFAGMHRWIRPFNDERA